MPDLCVASSHQLIDELIQRLEADDEGGLAPGDARWLAAELCAAAIEAERQALDVERAGDHLL